ncbi:MAG: outer membrane protein assembly factor BamD [Balneola sp.]|jgi:outer membrane protein assembly factor BamD|tara:strand:- start:161121 stop:161954 length:834 start_codon:yes stop_codon:yes gene_type:complete
MNKISYFLLISIFLITACKSTRLVNPGDSVEEAYQKGITNFEEGNYSDAAEIFETVTRIGRGSEYAQQAQYYLAESYFNQERYILAESEYLRFITFYPRDPKREEVDFKKAISIYEQSPRYRLDQTATRRAIDEFQLFNSRYPNSEYVTQSADKINELREKLARKYFESAQFYSRTDQYKAATIYYDLVIDRYPESKWAEAALIKQIETYNDYAFNSVLSKQIERYELAISNYEKYIQLFPQGNGRGEAESLRDQAEQGIKDAKDEISERQAENQSN